MTERKIKEESERQWTRETGKERTRQTDTDSEICVSLFAVYSTKPGLALHKNNNCRCQYWFCLRRSSPIILERGKEKEIQTKGEIC